MDVQHTTTCGSAPQVSQRPWFKFHRAQWLGNIKLRACSLEARGLFADILAATDPDGYVRVTLVALAHVAGIQVDRATALIAELERNGVLHRGTDDLVLVRTIARDHAQTCYGHVGGLASAKKRGGSKGALEGRVRRHPSNRRAISTLSSDSDSESPLRIGSLSPSEGSSLSSQGATQGSCSPKPVSGAGGNPATRAWDEEYLAALNAKFAWLPSKARNYAVALAECLTAASGDIGELRRRARCLLRSERKWHVEHRTPRGLLDCWNDFPPARAVASEPPTVQDARVDAVVGRTLDSLLGGVS